MRTFLKLAVAAAVASAAPAVAQQQPQQQEDFTTARGLAAACEGPAANGRNFCLGVFFGALGMNGVLDDLAYEGQRFMRFRMVCPPPRISFADLRDEFPRWVRNNPSMAQESSARAVFLMLSDIFPCEETPILAPGPAPAAPAPAPAR